MKLPKFNSFIKEGQKIVKESKAKKNWKVGDVKKLEKQVRLVVSNEENLKKNKEKLEKLLHSFLGYKQGPEITQANQMSYQEGNTESFLDVLKQMFPDIIK